MVSNYRETSDRLRVDPRYAAGASEMDALALSLRTKGLLPNKIESQSVPELQLEWNRQSSKLARLFAKELKFKTPEEYIATLPQFYPQPESWKGRFDIPVIVDTRVPLKMMLELAGIVTYFDVNSIEDWEKDKFTTPKTPYTAWVNDGSINLNKSTEVVRRCLNADERGATIYDGVALFLKDPEILDSHYLDFPGSQVGSGFAPCLLRWGGRSGLFHRLVDSAGPLYGSVVAGKL